MKTAKFMALALAAALLSGANTVKAEGEYTLTIKDHKFTPAALEIPAGQKVKITINNQDPTAEEFESHDLDREKVIAGNSTGIVLIGPLSAGTYNFVGEYNEDTAKGQIVVK